MLLYTEVKSIYNNKGYFQQWTYDNGSRASMII